ncbi:YfbR-like 5'-deoxynucleotidase [Aureimonas sp. AU40]|uniref:YfbR-like 5'-deoxynucleotidase n=1 Tax=Aureimonas sp. AU40 TaxID=1637747 RepID=UPI000780EA3F|nr:YfbR-like 5'-deoxynucleotidase [Aureimonas sp. AU40]
MNAHHMQSNDVREVDIDTTRLLLDRHGRERVGRYMHTAAGTKWFPFDVRADEVSIETIAHQLAGQNRWQGAVQHRKFKTRIFYSVAEHSVYCSHEVPDEFALEALMHDASEAYIGDLIRPLKYDPSFRAPFKVVEDAHEKAIAERFGLAWPWPKWVKRADNLLCAAESRQIVVRSPDEEWESGKLQDESEWADVEIEMLHPYQAKEAFLMRFHELYDIHRNVRR